MAKAKYTKKALKFYALAGLKGLGDQAGKGSCLPAPSAHWNLLKFEFAKFNALTAITLTFGCP